MNKKINIPLLAINLAIPLAIGGLSGFLIKNYTDDYKAIPKPPLSPPSWLFPVVWTILFILMGISAYIISTSEHEGKRRALIIYGIQLAVNFAWSPVFFIAKKYLLAFFILLLLIVLVSAMITAFSQISKVAGRLQIPYMLWLLFAGYLNFGVYLLNR